MSDDQPDDATPNGREMIHVSSIFGARTHLPLVTIAFRNEEITIVPHEARMLALNLIGAAEAAEYDGLAWDVFHVTMGMAPAEAAQVMSLLRRARAHRHQQEEHDG